MKTSLQSSSIDGLISAVQPYTRPSTISPNWRCATRRLISISLLVTPTVLLLPSRNSIAGGFFDKYVKKKKLDPLEAYIPAVILTEQQIKDLVKLLDDEKPEFAICRTLLRSGPAASLRANIRAVAQYASDGGNGKVAFDDVDHCLRALEELDSLLLLATREDPKASVKLMKEQIEIALSSLNSVLQTVPIDVLRKGEAVANAYVTSDDPQETYRGIDDDLTRLQSIL